MLFVYVCWTCSVIKLETRFETWIARIIINDVYWFQISYLVTGSALAITFKCAHKSKHFRNLVLYVWLGDLQTIWTKYGLKTWLPPNNDIRICLLDMQHSWTKNAIWILNNKKWSKWCILVSILLLNNCFSSGH
jgi:hypothetical protein